MIHLSLEQCAIQSVLALVDTIFNDLSLDF